MRLLYLTNGFPYPLTSGYLRHYYLLRGLSRHHAVTLMSIVGPGFDARHVEAVAPFTERVLTFASASRGRSLPYKVLQRVRATLRPDPAVAAMRDAVAALSRQRRFDVVFCGKRTVPAITPLRAVPLIADMCDATLARIRGSMQYAAAGRRLMLWFEAAQTRRAELAMMRRAAHSVFISQRDRQLVLGDAVAGTSIMPNGVDLEFWRRTAGERGMDTIVFSGAMNYRPNVDAALYLIEAILPAVRRVVPAAKLLIVGRDPVPRLRRAGRQPGVEVTGYVDDVRPFLDRATVFAAPLRFGAGMQNKVLEAMAMELPVVASSLVAAGLRGDDGEEPPLRVADGRGPFSEALVDVLVRRREDGAPAAEARRFVATHFVWERSAAHLDGLVRRVAAGAGLRDETVRRG